jgi:FtsP/CotA-like multicopper oxidase with cupredoxin domain
MRYFSGLLVVFMLWSCQNGKRQQVYDLAFLRSRNVTCGTPKASLASIFPLRAIEDSLVIIDHPRYLEAGKSSGLDLILPNDNRIPAGTLSNKNLKLDLEVKWGDFRMETPDRPGLKLVAVGEVGKPATIPSPLVRIKKGTFIDATVHNTLKDSTITLYGFQKRPYSVRDSLFILPGETGKVSFEAGEAGTYLYWIKLGMGHKKGFFAEESEQLAGAFVIDPEEGPAEDRIYVMNVFSSKHKQKDGEDLWLESLTINGLSWPFTERIEPEVGDILQWRVVNASNRNHPMHLHGFYFDVLERGNDQKTSFFEEEQIPEVVTETMRGRTTMQMRWEVMRPGNWLFHCHLSFHVTSDLRLPKADKLDPEGVIQHMAGLVLGIKVKDGASDLIEKGTPKNLNLYATQSSDEFSTFKFSEQNSDKTFTPGDLLVLKQYQATNITVKNTTDEDTSVHWHGLEIDSWADGVPDWSSSDGRSSPAIKPGNSFTYKLSTMRAGTFVYHSHLEDIKQLTQGLYGPMIIIGENELYHPELDHFYMMGWKNSNPGKPEDLDLNGWEVVPDQQAKIGETHRLRLINIAPAGNGWIRMTKDDKIIPIKAIAKDGADFPLPQQIEVEVTPRLFVGETADYSFTPTEPGVYTLKVNYMMARWEQTWIVTAQ